MLQKKCFQYWPCGEVYGHVDQIEFGNFRIYYIQEKGDEFFTIRTLELESVQVSLCELHSFIGRNEHSDHFALNHQWNLIFWQFVTRTKFIPWDIYWHFNFTIIYLFIYLFITIRKQEINSKGIACNKG